MEQKKPAADRVRHILQAMERSIDAARQRRVTGGRPPVPAAPSNAPALGTSDPIKPMLPEKPGRLRARPKRSTPLAGFDNRTPMRPAPTDDR